jgi:hypothetical protein
MDARLVKKTGIPNTATQQGYEIEKECVAHLPITKSLLERSG